MSLLNRNRSVLAKIESAYGSDPTPTGAANAIGGLSNLVMTPQEATLVPRDLVRPYLGNSAQLPAAIFGRIAFEVEVAGSGTAETPTGYGPLLRACGFAETITAAVVTGTAAAGSSTTITLVATSATDNAYNGMPISITGGTGSGQSRIISDYVGSTKVATVVSAWTTPPDATSVYSIGKNVRYSPISSAFESITAYFNIDGVRHILKGCRGTVAPAFGLWTIPKFKFTFTGIYALPTDSASPTVVLSAFQLPATVNNTNTGSLVAHGYASAASSDIQIDLANEVAYRSLVGGSEQVVLTDRKAGGSLMLEATTVAAKDWWTPAQNGTPGVLSFIHGTVAGNKVAVTAPTTQITKPNYAEKDQIAMLQMGMVIQPYDGNDDLYICTY